ncbi:DNA-directed RNA polymerase sigma-70 factor [Luteitalea sp. TBR-22]|uniref:RNA polymerase sigma factor n=1 Tax=Luteitalea sp. TBR-22 TaxID=2802971 RepID=UPI001AF15A30|nr:sigma-70 family RNA polymerase sigma factor [Luteitalea sp. TBR-22]BCS34828.1 DNA-directed RNA polymerase sigma-70 factor [Luteitalea sp. TBR-22]
MTESGTDAAAPERRGRVSGRAEDGWTDARLVEACLSGNQAAWAALVERYARLIYSVPRRYQATPEDAEDIFQTVCLELYNALPRLRKVDSLRSWLMTVASHASLAWKTARTRRGHVVDVDDADPVRLSTVDRDLLEDVERDQLVRDAVRSLPERCRELVGILFFEQPPRSYKEVAAHFGLAVGSLGFIRGRCLQKLQKALREAGIARA